MQRRRLHKPGYRSAACWALEHLGLKRADKLIKLAERMEVLPALDGAFFRGEVPWTKVREIARVAVRETVAQWLEIARSKTSREIEQAVFGLKRGALPGDRLGLGRSFQAVRIPLLAEDHARWETAVRKLRREQGKGSTPRDALMAMVDMALRMNPEGKVPGRRERGISRCSGLPGLSALQVAAFLGQNLQDRTQPVRTAGARARRPRRRSKGGWPGSCHR